MYIYNNTCGVNSECEYGYSLYFPCVKTLTRGENACFDFYIVDNATKKEVDLREVDDITLNISGRYNCNFGSYSYPENIKTLQVEKFSELVYSIDFFDIINHVKLYIDIVDEKHQLIKSYLFDENLNLDIAIEGAVGYFLNGSNTDGVLNLTGYDTKTYMFLGWNIDESDSECDNVILLNKVSSVDFNEDFNTDFAKNILENIYDFLIKSRNLVYNVSNDLVIRAVYQKRREYTIQMNKDNYNSSFIVEYMGEKTIIRENVTITALEGHDVKISCIPNDDNSYKFVKWDDGYKSPYRVIAVSGDDLNITLKAQCTLNENIELENYGDDIDASTLNNFKSIYPEIKDSIFVDEYYIDNIYVNNCEIDVLNHVPYIKIIEGGYIQIININKRGIFKLSLNNVGGNCMLFIDNNEVPSSAVENNEFIFEFDGGIFTLTGEESYIFGLKINKEVIYERGKCMLCLTSEDTLKLHPGDLTVEGGVIVNGNPYGISSVKFAKVTDTKPLVIKK